MINVTCSETGNCPSIRELPDGDFAVTGALPDSADEATVIVPRAVVEAAFGDASVEREQLAVQHATLCGTYDRLVEQNGQLLGEPKAERAALAGYRLAADTEPDDELTRVWPTLNHLPCGAGVFGYDPMDADELDLATLLRVVADHCCATAPDAPACECGCPLGRPCRCNDSADHAPVGGGVR